MPEPPAQRPLAHAAGRLATVAVVFALLQIAAFHCGLYRRILDPASSTAAFADATDALRRAHTDPARDVLVFGDSRIYAGFEPAIASKASRSLRFLSAAIPGTSPRVWYFLDRAVDPRADRFRAVVIPVDSLRDDTSAIGSLDANEHATDLGYVLFDVRPGEVGVLARSFGDSDAAPDLAMDLLLRGPLVRPDVASLLADPLARFSALRTARHDRYDPAAAHPFASSLAGLAVDFRSGSVRYPPRVTPDERASIADQVLRVPTASAAYATYRRRWLVPIVRHYLAAHVPVILVRVPTRPLHRTADVEPSGVLASSIARGDVALLPPAPFLALERPELFADHDHLDRAGTARFSALVGHDVATYLATRPARSTAALMPAFSVEPIASRFPSRGPGAMLGFGHPIPIQSVTYAMLLLVVLAALACAGAAGRTAILLLASLFFYARWNAWYVVMLAFITLTDYVIGRALAARGGSRRLLAAGVAVNLAFLGTLKYANFLTATLSAAVGLRSDPWFFAVLVPIGISFHTFQSISYLVDVHRDPALVERRLDRYALYVAFFPQLLAGPIVRARTFFAELAAWRLPDLRRLESGVILIAIGLTKKICIADRFAACSDWYFAKPQAHPGGYDAWGAALSFAIQIYFDFAGYTDIAVGSARVLGFEFPANFRRPYLASSVRDFWRRWNITLSSWLRDYLYVPLGGDRGRAVATYRNLMLTMLLGGLWHGASWTFVAWGGYQGALLCTERVLDGGDTGRFGAVRVARTLATFVLVVFGWVVFRSATFADASFTWSQMVLVHAATAAPVLWPMILVACVMSLEVVAEFKPDAMARLAEHGVWKGFVLLGSLVALESIAWTGVARPFVYFKF